MNHKNRTVCKVVKTRGITPAEFFSSAETLNYIAYEKKGGLVDYLVFTNDGRDCSPDSWVTTEARNTRQKLAIYRRINIYSRHIL
jgi:hypothetical protein